MSLDLYIFLCAKMFPSLGDQNYSGTADLNYSTGICLSVWVFSVVSRLQTTPPCGVDWVRCCEVVMTGRTSVAKIEQDLQSSPPKTKTSISEIIGGTAIVAQNGSVGMMSTRFSCVLQMPWTGECVAGKAFHGGMRCLGGTVEFRWMRFRYFTHLFSIALPVYIVVGSEVIPYISEIIGQFFSKIF